MTDVGRELGWDDEIEHDSPDYVILPEGDYDFEVVHFERGRHPGSEKLPPCNKAVVHIRIDTPEGSTTIYHNLFLHTKTEGLLTQFFTAIGLRKKGERIRMDWNRVVGARGRAKVGIRKWTGDDGNERVFNEIKRFYEPEEQPQPRYQAGSF